MNGTMERAAIACLLGFLGLGLGLFLWLVLSVFPILDGTYRLYWTVSLLLGAAGLVFGFAAPRRTTTLLTRLSDLAQIVWRSRVRRLFVWFYD